MDRSLNPMNTRDGWQTQKLAGNNLDVGLNDNKEAKVHCNMDAHSENVLDMLHLYSSLLTHLSRVIQYLSDCLVGNLIASLVL